MAKQKISVVRGTTNSFSIEIIDESTSEVYELESGEVIRFGIKKNAEDAQYIVEKEITEADENDEYSFTLAVSDTANLPFGTYAYDVGLESGNAYYNVIPASDFIVAKAITKWEGV